MGKSLNRNWHRFRIVSGIRQKLRRLQFFHRLEIVVLIPTLLVLAVLATIALKVDGDVQLIEEGETVVELADGVMVMNESSQLARDLTGFTLAVAMLVLTILLWTFVRWRIRSGDAGIELPDRVFDKIDHATHLAEDELQRIDQLGQQLRELGTAISERDSRLGEHLTTIAELADERGRELDRYREGFNLTITRNFAIGVISALDSLQTYIDELSRAEHEQMDSGLDYLRATKDRLTEVLDAQDIDIFVPKVGTVLSDLGAHATVRDVMTTDKDDDVGRVSDVMFPGYTITTAVNTVRVVRPAHVRVFRRSD